MTAPLDFDPVAFVTLVADIGHHRLLAPRYRAHGDDWIELAFDWREGLVGDHATGVIASGPIITVMDIATSIAVWLRTGTIRPQATLDLRVDYLRPPKPGRTMIGRGECYRLTNSIAFVRGEAHDGDATRPVAHVTGSYAFT